MKAPRTRSERLRKIINSGLIIASLGLFVVLIEYFVFPSLVQSVPLKFHSHLGDGRALAQSTKRGAIPKGDWIALVGDSHANGNGDWLMSVDPSKNPPFHSAHVIHQLTGRDVMSFGHSGAGSVWGFVGAPRKVTEVLRLADRYAFNDPAVVVAYFYAGNDLNNNLTILWNEVEHEDVDLEAFSDTWLDDYIERITFPAKVHGSKPNWSFNLYFLRLFGKLAENTIKNPPPEPIPQTRLSGNINRAMIGGKVTALPNHLQAPSLDLNEQETALSFRVTERSIFRLGSLFPKAKIVVVYLPSPLEVYTLIGDQVSVQASSAKQDVYSTEAVEDRSAELCLRLAEIANASGSGFVDTRQGLRQEALQGLVHGPRDWKHPNQRGYRVIGKQVVDALSASTPPHDRCVANK